MRCTARTLPPTIATMATMTVMGCRSAKTIGFMRVIPQAEWFGLTGRPAGPSRAGPGPGLLAAVGIEGVIDDPLPRQDFVVILQAQMAEALGDGFQARGLGAAIKVRANVRPVHDLREQADGGVADLVAGDDGLETALPLVVPELHAADVERDHSFPPGPLKDLLGRDEQELGVGVHEPLDKPGTGHPVHLHLLAGNPLHHTPPWGKATRIGVTRHLLGKGSS